MKRLDAVLVELKLAPSRSKAQQMIEAGEVELLMRGEWRPVLQPSHKAEPEQVRVRPNPQTLKFVSRGGLKLEAALERLRLDVTGWTCLDVGTSTGGFADCLLQHGAAQVTGLDVGHGQLAESLRGESRLKLHEGVNVRGLGGRPEIGGRFDLCVCDVSFISLEHVLPPLGRVLAPGARLLALVKPQFEVGAGNLDKHGIVRDSKLLAEVHAKILRALEKCDFTIGDYFACALKGQDGNQEFFAYATHR
jgi:23S rRNA (cytidine1920-2'-O)/16S rRNA (cytidine1409-2'-O)-methyltransferase